MIRPFLSLLRPAQWLKNMMLFFPLVLAGQAMVPGGLGKGILPFCAFCLVSSAGYLCNDLLDRERDKHHPQKSLRPIPAGLVSVRAAWGAMALLLVSGMFMATVVSNSLFGWLVGYGVLSLLYSFVLKNIAVVDLFAIAAGFLIRLQAGAGVYDIPISPWLFLSVFLLSVFLATGKRLSEAALLGDEACSHRTSLGSYPDGFLMGTMYMSGATVLVTYAMYVLTKPKLIYSVPLCLFGLLRYMQRIMSGGGGDPTEALFKDRWLFLVGGLWVIIVVWSIYG